MFRQTCVREQFKIFNFDFFTRPFFLLPALFKLPTSFYPLQTKFNINVFSIFIIMADIVYGTRKLRKNMMLHLIVNVKIPFNLKV